MPLGGQRNGNAVRADVAARRTEAIRLTREGYSWQDIADMLGYASRGAAFTDVKRAMQLGLKEMFGETELWRYHLLEQHRELVKSLWPNRGDEKVATVILRTLSAVADLTGAKAPVRYEIGESDVDRLLRDAIEEFNRRAGADDRQAAAAAGDQGPDWPPDGR